MSLAPAGLLQLMWLASPALPVGGFSYSEGLEAAVEWASLATESVASDWLVDQLHLSLARADLPVVAQSMAAWRDAEAGAKADVPTGAGADLHRLQALNAWVLQTRESSELRLQTEQMGRSFVEWLRLHHPDVPALLAQTLGDTTATYPLAFALAASRAPVSIEEGCLAFAFGWAENMTAAAVKAVPLGQSAGQRILGRLAAAIPDAVALAVARADGERQAFTPMLAILSARHETQYSRLFRS